MKSRSAWSKNGTKKARKLKNEKSKRLIKSAILGNADIFVVVLNMIERNTDLYNAWQLKEMFYEFKDCKKARYARKLLLKFILAAERLELPEFKECLSAMHNWATPILNSFQHKYTNAFTEGSNNTIKVLKRISYGYRRFDRFKKKILFVLAS